MAGRVTVVGAGVVGLSCAVRLAESGAEVNVVARDLPPETTSAAAGGLWLPFVADRPGDPGRWARDTLAELTRLADRDPEGGSVAGVRILPGRLTGRLTGRPGSHPVAPLVDLPRYLAHLTHRLRAAGGTLTRMALPALPTRGVVVNCTGVSARALTPDRTVHAVRSQVALLTNPGLDEWWYGEQGRELTFVLPRGGDVIVGATLDDDDWGTVPDDDAGQRLVERARRLVPALRDAEVRGHRVGLRPQRSRVRLEVERKPTPDDPEHVRVHCYGHGGEGVTLAWGCAGDVAHLVSDLVIQPALPL